MEAPLSFQIIRSSHRLSRVWNFDISIAIMTLAGRARGLYVISAGTWHRLHDKDFHVRSWSDTECWAVSVTRNS